MCGLAGIISTEKTDFNINHFNVLGTLNDERGGDSCGIFIDKKFQHGIKEYKQFRCFTRAIKDYPEQARIALLHCRKASPGYPVNIEQAQPIIISKDDKIEYVLMHNGTIYNAPKLAKKYIPDFDTKGLSDSQIMANIMYQKGYDCLTEYEGAAVFIIVDYRNNENGEVLFWKGNSCYNEYNESHERPLFFMVRDNKFYFSSMVSSLYCIDHNSQVYIVPTNTLMWLDNNELKDVKKYDRTKLTKYTTPVTTYQSSFDYDKSEYITYNQYTGLYMKGNEPAHGEFTVYSSGMLTKNTGKYVYTFYFMYGRLLYSKECYEFLSKIFELFDETILDSSGFEVVDYFSYSPLKKSADFYEVDENFEYVKCINKHWYSLFTNSLHYSILNNHLNIGNSYTTNAIEHFTKESEIVYFNFELLEEDIVKYLIAKCCDAQSI